MPIIKLRQQPLLPEGEYAGQARKVTQEWSKPKAKPDGTTPESVMIFRVPLWLPSGKSVTAFLRVMENTGWIWEQACKSGEMIPQSEEVQFTPDDFENRVFYFGIVHTEHNGIPRAEVKFHTKSYAIQVNPELEHATFPNAAPRPIYLKSATPAVLDSSFTPPQKPSDAAPPKADAGPPPPAPSPSPAPPVNEAKEQPPGGNGIPEGISEDEFKQALELAKRLAAEKRNPKGKTA